MTYFKPIHIMNTLLFLFIFIANTNAISKEINKSEPLKQSPQSKFTAPNKVIAIGDIHGAYSQLSNLLTELNVIDLNGDWIAKDTYLVSLGDIIDRGAESRKVLNLLIKLQQQAPKVGGKVIQVLGNHELMVTTGDYRHVSKEEFNAFAQEETEAQRNALFDGYMQQVKGAPSKSMTKQGIKYNHRQTFDKKYPHGYSAFVKAFSSQGVYGKWLRSALPAVKVNDAIFVHGGLSSKFFFDDLHKINSIMNDAWAYQAQVEKFQEIGILPIHIDYWQRAEYLNTLAFKKVNRLNPKTPKWHKDFLKLHELQSSFAFDDNSPMWYRGNAFCHPYSESFTTERILKKLDANYIVIGHSPLYKKMRSRMNQTVILTDTGMLNEVYHGNATALIIENGEKKTFTLGQQGYSPIPVEVNKYSAGSSTMTDAEIEDFLRTGKLVSMKKIGIGITNSSVITLEKDGKIIKALYKTFDSDPNLENIPHRSNMQGYTPDRYHHEIAAYRLDRMLGLNLVPVAIKRKFEDRTGVVQFWIDGLISEQNIRMKKQHFESFCRKVEQFRVSYIFDSLIYNNDRNQTNINFLKENGMMYLIDHSRAFSLSKTKPSMYKEVDLRLSSLFRTKLESLTIKDLTLALRDVLSRYSV
ncbi:MAG: metallophosphoesterase [Colwellia sp.]